MDVPIRRCPLAVVAMVSAAGLPASIAQAAVFTFNQQCASTNWYGECTTTPCGGGGTNTFNNWGQTGCSAGLPLPGALDSVVLSGATVNLNGNANILSFTTDASTNWTWSLGNLTVGQPSVSNGTMTLTGNVIRTLQGTITNAGTWSEDTGGNPMSWSTATLTNNGSMTLGHQNWTRAGSTTNSFTNNGTFTKNAMGTMAITGIAFAQNGTLTVDGDLTVQLNAFPMSFGAVSSTNVLAGRSLTISTGGLQGVMNGANAGTLALINPTLTGPLTVNIAGPNPVVWSAGNFALATHTLSIAAGSSVRVTTNNRTISSGSVTNNGTWIDDGGFATFMSNVAFTNNSVHTLGGQSYTRVGSSSNSYTNEGTINKVTSGVSTWSSIAFNQNAALNVQDGSLIFTGTFPNTFAASSTTNTSPAALLSLSTTSVAGTLRGANAGAMTIASPSLANNFTMDVSGNPVEWTSGNISLNGHTLRALPATDVLVSGASGRVIGGGAIVNEGVWTDNAASSTSLSTVAITNNGTWNLPGQSYSRFGSSANSITNNGILNKTGVGTSTVSTIAFNQNGTLNVQDGTFVLTGTFPSIFDAASTTNTSVGGTLTFSGNGAAGNLRGTNNGSIRFDSPSLAGDLTINTPGNPVIWSSGNMSLGDRTLTIAPGTSVEQVVPVSVNATGGVIINNGSWTDNTGGLNTALSTVAITNNGTWNLVNQNYSRFGSAFNSITNNGVLRKTGSGGSAVTGMPITNNGLFAVEGGTLTRTSFVYTQTANGTTRAHADTFVQLAGTQWEGGRLEGLGSISTSNGFIFTLGPTVISPGQPGDEGGTLTLSGGTQIVLGSDDTLDIQLDARPSDVGGADRLLCGHAVTGGGATLRVSLAPGFIPTLGDVYEVLRTSINLGAPTPGSLTPVFDVPSGASFTVGYTPQTVTLTVTGVPCDDIDFNNDDLFPDDADLIEFLNVLAGGSCESCADIDFNNDGLFPDDTDLVAFLRVLSGGPCE